VLTFVEPWDDALLQEAMARELDRGGQVFFVHNRIETIATIAGRVQALAPARPVAVAHGRCARPTSNGDGAVRPREVDVLLSTMIVESGLDVPNANTMIVDRADRLGLHSCTSCVARRAEATAAYCYLLVPDQVDARRRNVLRVLEHHTDLGSAIGSRCATWSCEAPGTCSGASSLGTCRRLASTCTCVARGDGAGVAAGARKGGGAPHAGVESAGRHARRASAFARDVRQRRRSKARSVPAAGAG